MMWRAVLWSSSTTHREVWLHPSFRTEWNVDGCISWWCVLLKNLTWRTNLKGTVCPSPVKRHIHSMLAGVATTQYSNCQCNFKIHILYVVQHWVLFPLCHITNGMRRRSAYPPAFTGNSPSSNGLRSNRDKTFTLHPVLVSNYAPTSQKW